MTIDEFFSLFNTTKDDDYFKSDKEVVDVHNIKHDGYETGTILNKFNNNTFGIYLYVENKSNIVSNLLCKKYKNLKDAKKYFTYLKDICNVGDLDKISKLIR